MHTTFPSPESPTLPDLLLSDIPGSDDATSPSGSAPGVFDGLAMMSDLGNWDSNGVPLDDSLIPSPITSDAGEMIGEDPLIGNVQAIIGPGGDVTFVESDIVSYGGSQDATPTEFSVLDGGATLNLEGNTWKALPLSFTVTASTVLEFDFTSLGVQPEINAIGLDEDLIHNNGIRTFQLFGTQTYVTSNPNNGAFQDFNNYPGSGTVSYSIPIGQFLPSGPINNLVFLNDNDTNLPGVSVSFSNVRVFDDPDFNLPPTVDAGVDQFIVEVDDAILSGMVADDGLPEPPQLVTQWTVTSGPGTVTFDDATSPMTTATFSEPGTYILRLTADDGELVTFDEVEVEVLPAFVPVEFDPGQVLSYGGAPQDQTPTEFDVLDGGDSLNLRGNTWKAIPLETIITPDTVLVFEFSSDGPEPEINAIGLDEDLIINNGIRTFQLFGTQTFDLNPDFGAFQDFNNYPGSGTTSYVIPIGQFLPTGLETNFLVFLNDNDQFLDDVSVTYSNITLFNTEPLLVEVFDSPPGFDQSASFTSQVRFGNAASNGDFEATLTSATGVSSPQEAQFAWPNGGPVPFEFVVGAVDMDNRVDAMLTLGSQILFQNFDAGVQPYTNLVVFAASQTAGSSISLDSLVLNGVNVGVDLTADFDAGDGFMELSIGGPDFSAGFTLTGNLTLAWDPTLPLPNGSRLQAQFIPVNRL